MTFRRVLVRILFGRTPTPLYAAVGLSDPQEEVTVTLTGIGASVDVTRNLVVASLRPFMLATVLPSERPGWDRLRRSRPEVTLGERGGEERTTGRIRLVADRRISLPDHDLALFRTSGSENACVRASKQRLFDLHQWWRRRSERRGHNFEMAPEDLRPSYVFYFCPRPVYLVTAAFEGRQNLFPMDLVGPTDSPYFLMALRKTSPSNRLMSASGRMVLSAVPPRWTPAVYRLGTQHNAEHVDLDAIQFEIVPSAAFGLPRMADAVAVREVEVVRREEVGSHYLYVTRTVRFETVADGPCLFHVHGFYEELRKTLGRPLESVDGRQES